MSWSLINATGVAPGGSTATTPAVDMRGANLLVALTTWFNGGATMTDSLGNTWTAIAATGLAFQGFGTLWYVVNPVVGATQTFTMTGNGANSLCVAGFYGATVSPLDQAIAHTGGSATSVQPGSITPTQNGELIISTLGATPGGSGFAINSGFTIAVGVPGAAGVAYTNQIAYFAQGTAAAINPTWSWTGSVTAGAGIASFKAIPSQPLTGKITAQVKAKPGIRGGVSVLARTAVQVKGVLGNGLRSGLKAKGTIQVKGKAKGIGGLLIKGRAAAQVKGPSSVIHAQPIFARMTVMVRGKLESVPFRDPIQAFTAYFWKYVKK